MLDWLHWGGGLILGSPEMLESLRGSFLDAYLPARVEGTISLDAAALAPLNAHWTLADAAGYANRIVAQERLVRRSIGQALPGGFSGGHRSAGGPATCGTRPRGGDRLSTHRAGTLELAEL